MKDNTVDEIIINLPGKRFIEQYDKFKKFQFLDLIGVTDQFLDVNEDEFTKLNRLAVENQQIDAVF
jgi:hypothetical protein